MKLKMIIAMLLISTGVYALPTKSVTVAFDPSPDASVTGYKIYTSLTSGVYTAANAIDIGLALTYTLPITTPRRYFFVATAYAGQMESDFSNEISFLIPRPPLQMKLSGTTLTVASYAGAEIQIESSTNLLTWSKEQTITSETGTDTITIDNTQPRKFYRSSYTTPEPVVSEGTQIIIPPTTSEVAAPTSLIGKVLSVFKYKPGMHPGEQVKGATRLLKSLK